MPHHTCVPSSIDPHLYCTTFAHLRANIFPVRAYRNLSKSIRTYQKRSEPFRLVLINSDSILRTYRPPSTIPRAHRSAPCVYQSTAPSPRYIALSHTHLRTSAPIAAYLRSASAYLPHQFSTQTCHRSAPQPSNSCRSYHTFAHLALHSMHALPPVCARSHSFLQRERSGSPIRTNRCSHTVRGDVRIKLFLFLPRTQCPYPRQK